MPDIALIILTLKTTTAAPPVTSVVETEVETASVIGVPGLPGAKVLVNGALISLALTPVTSSTVDIVKRTIITGFMPWKEAPPP